MPWSLWAQRQDEEKKRPHSWSESLIATDWQHFKDPKTIFSSLLLTSLALILIRTHRSYLRRIPEATHITHSSFRKRSLFGVVTRVGDADNFHLFHTPGGRLMGWGWLPGRKIPAKKIDLKGRTIHIRLAGIDAPELAHWGKPAQPHSAEALAWLENYIYNRRVRAYIYKRDQYERVVATVWVRRFLVRRDVGREMLKAGLATVYEAKSGAEFGEFEKKYRMEEEAARKRKVGIWAGNPKLFESPREYKTRNATVKNG
ncbi:putative endonuclease [Podosphaera aphanis]|nr:putative endonuclease [Podosphaera aphanis]